MSPNKYKPHLFVLPEDDPNRQIANGFLLNPALNERAIQVLPVAGGWKKVRDKFKNVHVHEMERFSERSILLIVDFDNQGEKRLLDIRVEIPNSLTDRAFILGAKSEPENLRADLGMSFEDIGKALSKDCVDNTRTIWRHDLLIHNDTELDRLISFVKPFLFN